MSFTLSEKEIKEENKNINEEKQINEENLNKDIIEMNIGENNKLNNENKINIKKQKTELELKKIFDKRRKNFHLNRDNYKRLSKNRTHGELNNFWNDNSNNSKNLENFEGRNNTLYILSKYKSSLNRTFGHFDKEKIKNEIYLIKNEMKIINDELSKLKEKEKEAKNKLIANQIIIEKVLKINNEKVEENKKEEKNKKEVKDGLNRNEKNENQKETFNGFYVTQITKDETKAEYNNDDLHYEKNIENYSYHNKDNNKYKKKSISCIKKKNNLERVKFIKIKNRIKLNNFSRLLLTLKREISDYDKSIESTSKLIESKKSEGKVNLFLNMNSLIDNKNKTLGELDTQRNALSEKLNNDNKKISLLSLRTKNIIQDQKQLEKYINTNQSLSLKYKNEIEKMKIEKETLVNELNKLENEKNNIKKIKSQKNEEKKALEEEIKNYEDIFKEKSNNEKELNDLNNKENMIKKNIAKNELNINKLKNNINYYKDQIQTYSQTLKLYNDYININKQIKKLKKGGNITKEKSQEISKLNLNNKLKELSEQLTEKNKLCEKLKSELDELKKEYETKIKNNNIIETENQKEGKLEQEKVKSPNNIEVEDDKKEKNEKEKDCIIF